MTTKLDLFNTLNSYRVALGKTPLKTWKQSVEKLDETVRALGYQVEAGCDAAQARLLAEQEIEAKEAGGVRELPEETGPIDTTKASTGHKKGSVKSRTIQLLTDEEHPQTAAQIAQILVDELDAKYSPASVAWYASKLRKAGTVVHIADARKKVEAEALPVVGEEEVEAPQTDAE